MGEYNPVAGELLCVNSRGKELHMLCAKLTIGSHVVASSPELSLHSPEKGKIKKKRLSFPGFFPGEIALILNGKVGGWESD